MRTARVLLSLLLATAPLGGSVDEAASNHAALPDRRPSVRTADRGARERLESDVHVASMPTVRPSVRVPPSPVRVVAVGPRPIDGSDARAHAIRGLGSWYDDGPGLYAAVHSYRWGQPRYTVRVCSEGRCVTVTVRDHCQCYVGTSRERLIDLSPSAFRALAPLSRGILRVTVEGMR